MNFRPEPSRRLAEALTLLRETIETATGPDLVRLCEEIAQLEAIARVRLIAAHGAAAVHAEAPREPAPLRAIGDGDPDRLVDVKEAAKILGMSPAYLYEHWRDYPFAQKQGNRLRFSTRGLRQHIARRFPSR